MSNLQSINNDWFSAVIQGNTNKVKRLISEGAEVNAVDEYNNTPLHYAATNGHAEIVKDLLDNGADVNAVGQDEKTPLHWAAAHGRKDAVDALLKVKGIDVNAQDKDGKTPLHFAAESGYQQVVQALLDKGADVNAEDEEGNTPLDFAVNHQDIETLLRNTAELLKAARGGNIDAVNDLIKKGASVNATDQDGKTPLHWAAQDNNKKVVEALLQVNGINVNVQDRDNMTPLHRAAEEGHQEVVEALLKVNGIDVNAQDKDGKTPLHFAAESGYQQVVQALLDKGADVNIKDKNEKTPLNLAKAEEIKTLLQNAEKTDYVNPVLQDDEEESQVSQNANLFEAIKGDNINEVKRLISEGADVNALDGNRFTPLRHAIVKGDKDMVSLLIDNKADVNAQSETGRALLHVAVDKANKTQPLDTSIIEALLEAKGINVNIADENGRTALHEAAKSYDKKIVTVLLEAKGIYVTPLDNTGSIPLKLASQQGRQHIVKILEETQKDIEALYSAVKSDNYEEVQSLLSKKVNVNSIDNDGKTLLHFAAIKGNVEIVRALIQTGADVNKKDKLECTPLHWAVLNGHKEVLEALLEKDEIDVNAQDKDNRTPLHWATGRDNVEVVNVLIIKGADVNAQDKDNRTPLHFAAQNNNKEIVDALIKAGADVNIKDEDGKTPLDLTTNEEIKTLLQPAEESDDSSVDRSPPDNIIEEKKGSEDTDKKIKIVDGERPQNNEGNPGKEKQGGNIQPEIGVKAEDVEFVAPIELAQTEEQPSSFFGNLFSILTKPFSLVASFFGGFFSWLFGFNEEKIDESTSQTDARCEGESSSCDYDVTKDE